MTDEQLICATLVLEDQSGKASTVAAYEAALCEVFGSPYAVALNSGSASITATLLALGAGPNRTVIVSASAPLPTLMPILATQAKIRFSDCSPNSASILPAGCEAVIDETVVAVVEVPLWGYPSDYTPLLDVLNDHKIPLIEDASHAHGSRVGNRFVGTVGNAGCFSTHHKKLLSSGEGGFVLTRDEELARRVRTISRLGNLDGRTAGYNFKMPAIVAALGITRLATLTDVVAARSANRLKILQLLRGSGMLELEHVGIPNGYNCVMRHSGGLRLHSALADAGIISDSIRYGYKPAYRHPIVACDGLSCPNAEALIADFVQLPTVEDPHYVAETLLKLLTQC